MIINQYYQLSADAAYGAVKSAISAGYRHFDSAEIYANESEAGAAFSEAINSGNVRREDLFITSKVQYGTIP